MKKNSQYLHKVNSIIASINQINPYILILISLCLHHLSFKTNGNEEVYIALAKQYMNPDWMPGSFWFNEWPANRVIFQYIFGFFLKFASFEQVAFGGRIIIFTLTTIPLVKLYKTLKFSNITSLIVTELFLLRQTWIGGETIFSGIESKSLAYIFIFYSLISLLTDKYYRAIVLAIIASYFHILVGGWYAVFALGCILFYKRSILIPLKLGLIYTVGLIPQLIYLSSYILESESIINGVNINWVYTFYRNPHHCAPFSRGDWTSVVLPSFIQLIVTSILLLTLFRKKKGMLNDKLFWMASVTHLMIWAAVIITNLDSSGGISKYYLFRIGSVTAFVFYIYVFWWTIHTHPKFARKAGYFLFYCFFIPLLIGRSVSNLKRWKHNDSKGFIELVDFLQNNTNRDAIIINHSEMPTRFSRMCEREVYVIKKLIPGNNDKIYEWYKRMETVKSIRDDISKIDQLELDNETKYLVSKEKLSSSQLNLKFSNDEYFLYRIE